MRPASAVPRQRRRHAGCRRATTWRQAEKGGEKLEQRCTGGAWRAKESTKAPVESPVRLRPARVASELLMTATNVYHWCSAPENRAVASQVLRLAHRLGMPDTRSTGRRAYVADGAACGAGSAAKVTCRICGAVGPKDPSAGRRALAGAACRRCTRNCKPARSPQQRHHGIAIFGPSEHRVGFGHAHARGNRSHPRRAADGRSRDETARRAPDPGPSRRWHRISSKVELPTRSWARSHCRSFARRCRPSDSPACDSTLRAGTWLATRHEATRTPPPRRKTPRRHSLPNSNRRRANRWRCS